MRLGAAIIVAIGVCIASLIVLDRFIISPELHKLDALIGELRTTNGPDSTKGLEDNYDFVVAIRVCLWILDLVAILILTVWFVNVSCRKVRRQLYYAEPAKNACEMMWRLSNQETVRFQYSIQTLLAVMLAVAIVCSAITCRFGK